MEILLVRHGQPAWLDADGLGDNDPGLTPVGRVQALQTAARLASIEVTELLASTANRAQQTVAPIAQALQLPVTDDDGLWEIRPPDSWQGAPAEVVARDFRQWRSLPREQWWDGPHGEPFRDFHQRVTSTIERLLAERGIERHPSDPDHLWDVERDDDRRIVLVAHNGTNSVILSHLLGIEPQPWEWERFNSNHAAVTTLRTVPIAGAAIWSLQHFSAVDHLDEVTA
jgi:probable phosphoglycerate mutase